MSEPAVIDLGLDRAEAEPVSTPWRRRPLLVRRWLPAAVAAVLVFPLGAAAAPTGPPLQRLWALPTPGGLEEFWERHAVDGERLFAVTPERLTAYRLADGQVEWEVPLDVEEEFWLRSTAGVLLVISNSDNHTDAYAPATGERRWSYPAGPLWVSTPDQVLMADGSGEEAVELDLETGRPVARYDLELFWDIDWLSPDGDHAFRLDRDGTLARLDLATGAVASIRTPHAEREADVEQNDVRVAGELLFVNASGGGDPAVLTAYDPATLTRQWSITGGLYTTPCHSLVCVYMENEPSEQVWAVDPATGEVRWRLDCPQRAMVASRCGDPGVRELPGGQLWVQFVLSTEADVEHYRSWLADPATGDPVTAVTSDWRLVDLRDGSGLLLSRDEFEPVERTWWARYDPDRGRVEVLGAVAAEYCGVYDPYLVCLAAERVEVWRIGG